MRHFTKWAPWFAMLRNGRTRARCACSQRHSAHITNAHAHRRDGSPTEPRGIQVYHEVARGVPPGRPHEAGCALFSLSSFDLSSPLTPGGAGPSQACATRSNGAQRKTSRDEAAVRGEKGFREEVAAPKQTKVDGERRRASHSSQHGPWGPIGGWGPEHPGL